MFHVLSIEKEKGLIKGILKKGVIQPLEPLPESWSEGQELLIEVVASADTPPQDVDWTSEVTDAMGHVPPEDHDKLLAAVAEHRREKHVQGLSSHGP